VCVSVLLTIGYEEGSFLLAWYDKDSNDPDAATPLSLKSTQTLFELDMPSEPERCYLYLRDGPDRPPIKVTTGGGAAKEGVELATAVSTSTSSHALNNTSNSWSSTNYSNKSDTGMWDRVVCRDRVACRYRVTG
jgi:hypothetical protein